MTKRLFFYFSLFLFVGCDSFPKKMQSERVGSIVKNQVQITAECNALISPYAVSDDKYLVIAKLYILNSSTHPIYFSPKNLLSTEQSYVEFDHARGAREASQKKLLSIHRNLAINAGEDYLIDLFFRIKDRSQLEEILFDISGVVQNSKKRPVESFACRNLKNSGQSLSKL